VPASSHLRRADDLALLHALIGHYARLVVDIQQLRIAAQLRAGAMRRDGIGTPWCAPLDECRQDLAALEAAADRQLVRLMSRHPLADWVASTPGIGLPGLGRLLGVTGPLDRFATFPQLWKFLGLHVEHGHAPQRGRDWSLRGRTVCFQLALAIMRTGHGPYRAVYDRKKAEYLSRERRGPSGCVFDQVHKNRGGQVLECRPLHVHNAAMRYAIKRMVRDLWLTWQRTTLSAVEVGDARQARLA
jgi:hypothetical protein